MGDLVPQPAEENPIDPDRAFVPYCPVCGGATQPANEVRPATMFACTECETTIFVPPGAWAAARAKRQLKWRTKNP